VESLILRAGQRAGRILRDEGLRPGRVRVVAGAAGGPKWLVLNGLDRFLFGDWLAAARTPLFLVGASIGAWRFAAAATADPAAAMDRFEAAYIGQRYLKPPTPAAVSATSRAIQTAFLGPDGPARVLSNDRMRLNVLAVRGRGVRAADGRWLQTGQLAATALANLCARRLLGLFFERVLFHDPRDRPPFIGMPGLPLRTVALTPENLAPALLASGSIPLVMSGVAGIAGAPAGVYRDGGLIDYHMDIPFGVGPDEIVLFPHYTDRIVPGWFDKYLPWRKATGAHLSNMVLVSPSPAFIRGLPYGKIPDRKDFYNFKGRDRQRIAYWRTVVRESRRLADAFAGLAAAGPLNDRVRPLE
jgi:hypothetical protein